MAWTEEETLKFQMSNKEHLEEINKTLSGCNWKSKIGIFAPNQNGDAITVSSVLKYKEDFWPDKDIIWFSNYPVAEFLMYNKEVAEVRAWPWSGNGLPIGTPDFYPLLCDKNNRLNLELAKQYELTSDLEDGVFPITWMVDIDNRRGVSYPNVSKNIFGLSDDLAWHPVLYFSDEERQMVDDFIDSMPKCKTLAFETFAGSGQSRLTDLQVIDAIDICRKELGKCNIIFTSHKFLNGNETFPEGLINNIDIFSIADFTVRQTALITGRCDIMISVSSGTTVAASCWGNPPIKILQFCGSEICSTKALSNGEFILVTHDDKSLRSAWEEFKIKLIELLKNIK